MLAHKANGTRQYVVQACALSPDSRFLAVKTYPFIEIFSTHTWRMVHRIACTPRSWPGVFCDASFLSAADATVSMWSPTEWTVTSTVTTVARVIDAAKRDNLVALIVVGRTLQLFQDAVCIDTVRIPLVEPRLVCFGPSCIFVSGGNKTIIYDLTRHYETTLTVARLDTNPLAFSRVLDTQHGQLLSRPIVTPSLDTVLFPTKARGMVSLNLKDGTELDRADIVDVICVPRRVLRKVGNEFELAYMYPGMQPLRVRVPGYANVAMTTDFVVSWNHNSWMVVRAHDPLACILVLVLAARRRITRHVPNELWTLIKEEFLNRD
jgi:hypothetical protein